MRVQDGENDRAEENQDQARKREIFNQSKRLGAFGRGGLWCRRQLQFIKKGSHIPLWLAHGLACRIVAVAIAIDEAFRLLTPGPPDRPIVDLLGGTVLLYDSIRLWRLFIYNLGFFGASHAICSPCSCFSSKWPKVCKFVVDDLDRRCREMNGTETKRAWPQHRKRQWPKK